MLDGYRSATIRMFEGLNVPVRCDIGPWDHSCPDDGSPGPNWEWQLRVAQWFNRYLRTDAPDSHRHLRTVANGDGAQVQAPAPNKEFMVYVRHGHAPDSEIETVPGYWRKDTLPTQGTRKTKFHLAGAGTLARKAASGISSGSGAGSADELVYHPFAGTAAGVWWGNKTGDVSADDALSLTYDSKPMSKPMQIIGAPHIRVKVKSTSEKAKWTVRLEDVAPDGKVMLITGSLFHPAHGKDGERRLSPEWPKAGEVYEVDVPMHFTTWTFQPGHKVRLAIANAQFPMTWPSPENMVSTVFSGDGFAALTLPVVPFDGGQVPHLPKVHGKQESPDSWSIDFPGKKEAATFNRYYKKTGRQSHTIVGNSAYKIREKRFFIETSSTWSTFDKEPWRSSYLGIAQTTIKWQGKNLRLRTRISVTSDKDNFYVTVLRTITNNGKVVRRRFHETIARSFQ